MDKKNGSVALIILICGLEDNKYHPNFGGDPNTEKWQVCTMVQAVQALSIQVVDSNDRNPFDHID
jgi:hypothetical protein